MKNTFSKKKITNNSKITLSRNTQSKGNNNSIQFSSSKSGAEFPKHWRQIAGTHAIKEVLRVRGKSIKHVCIQKNWSSSSELKALVIEFEKLKLNFEEKSDLELQKICHSHQGAVVYSDTTLELDYLKTSFPKQSQILALDGIEDPHNLGAIFRTSWLMGVEGIITPEDRAVKLTATVHKVACGGVEHVPIVHMNNFTEPFKKLKESGFWVFGLSHKATQTIYDLKIPDKVVWVLGAEDKGLRGTTEKNCDELVSIPQRSAEASYNVSVAAALVLAETKNRWKK